MSPTAIEELRTDIVLARELQVPGSRNQLYRMVRSGDLTALYRGIYLPAASWNRFDRDQQYLACVIAADLHSPGQVFSHHSAAALWRLPSAFGWPIRADVLQTVDAQTRSTSIFARHSVGIPDDAVTVDGIAATSLARTVVDLAARDSFASAVVFADAALRRAEHPRAGTPPAPLTVDDLRDEVDGLHLRQGSALARRVVEFADGRADRPGESLSRVGMAKARLPMPLLQVELRGASGTKYTVDFYWPKLRHIGEFDGEFKYSDPRFLKGRAPERALMDEKRREDDLRATDRRFSRWGWKTAVSPARLRALLVAAGIR